MSDSRKTNENENSDRSSSSAELKLELIEFLGEKISNIRTELRIEFDRSVKSYKHELKRQVQWYGGFVLFVAVFFGIATFTGLWTVYKGAVSEVKYKVSKRLDDEFASPEIQKLIEKKAAEATEGKVEQYVSAQVSGAIKPFSEEIRHIVSEADAELTDLRTIINLEDRARFGSRDAYEKLLKLATTKSKLSNMAGRRIFILSRDLSIYNYPPGSYFGLSLKKGGKNISHEELSTEELFDLLEDPIYRDEPRHTLMAYIAKRPKEQILKESVRILRESDFLPACAATCGILSKVLGEKAEFMNFDRWIKVCEEEINAGGDTAAESSGQ